MDKYSKLPKPMDMKESKFSAKKTEIWSISTQTRLMSSVKRYFDDRATTYLSQSSRGFWSILREKEKVAIQQTLKPFSKMACLELGSGSGYYTHLLASFSPSRLVAVDLSHAMLKALNIPSAFKVQADIQNVSFRVSFDRILCAGVLEFLPDPNSFLHNVRHLLSQDGNLILLLPAKGIMGQIYKWFHKSHQIEVNLFDRTILKSMLKESQLKINSIEKPTPMTYVLKVSNA